MLNIIVLYSPNTNIFIKVFSNNIFVAGACFDWFPVACATPKKKKKKGRKKSLDYSMKTFFYRFGFAFLLNF